MIEKDQVSFLLNQFDIGSSTAENDPLLESAKIETQEFNDLFFYDRIDIIRGIKGAGKTALYRLFFYLTEFLIEKKNLFCIFGVEASGDPVFRLYQKDFEGFNDIEFENFWSLYFIVLIYSHIHNDDKLKTLLKKDIKKIESIIDEMGLKVTKKGISKKDAISIIQSFFDKKYSLGIKTDIEPHSGMIKSVTPLIEITPSQKKELSSRPLYVAAFKDKIANILKSNGIIIWIMVDRLDEVFPHRSEIEKCGLRGILKASYNFSDPNLRIKIFLRDDIIGYLSSDGFTALTHVTDRSSTTMSWSKEDLLYLVTKRISYLSTIAIKYRIDKEQIVNSKEYREKIFYDVFPSRVGNSKTMDWIYTNCMDGNSIVTPRDVIDIINFAKANQLKQHATNPKSIEKLISSESFEKALEDLSKHKRDVFLFAEFPHLKQHILKFSGKYSDYSETEICAILGSEYIKIIDDLKSIGFIKQIHSDSTYNIPLIWRKGLNIKRTRSKKKHQK